MEEAAVIAILARASRLEAVAFQAASISGLLSSCSRGLLLLTRLANTRRAGLVASASTTSSSRGGLVLQSGVVREAAVVTILARASVTEGMADLNGERERRKRQYRGATEQQVLDR
jgi:hypothetical protein